VTPRGIENAVDTFAYRIQLATTFVVLQTLGVRVGVAKKRHQATPTTAELIFHKIELRNGR
jgi:hypothetical protein